MDIRRYDIVQADLGKAVGSEQVGIRPVLIVQNDQGNKFSNTTIIIPLTSKLKSLNQPTHTLIRKSLVNKCVLLVSGYDEKEDIEDLKSFGLHRVGSNPTIRIGQVLFCS